MIINYLIVDESYFVNKSNVILFQHIMILKVLSFIKNNKNMKFKIKLDTNHFFTSEKNDNREFT